MPWHIRGNAVVNNATGKVKGHSKNPKVYLRALYANVPEARSKKTVTRKLMKAHKG